MKLPKGVYRRNKGSPQLWVDYPDENGKRIRESAHTTDPQIAAQFRNLRLAAIAQARLVPTRKFETTTSADPGARAEGQIRQCRRTHQAY